MHCEEEKKNKEEEEYESDDFLCFYAYILGTLKQHVSIFKVVKFSKFPIKVTIFMLHIH